GNGNEIECHQICPKVQIHIQSHIFVVDVHVLPLSGADIVLGVQWMKSLGPIMTDYNDLTMKFIQQGKIVELRGNRDGGLHLMTASQVRRLLHTDGVSALFHIQVIDPEPPSTQMVESRLQSLLHRYDSLFQSPTSL
ncbi:retrotransposon protein, partial [Trifolium medium]|nr:retrotransposon protein [Trifolium medium]